MTLRILNGIGPDGAFTVTSSPGTWLMTAMPTGDSIEIRPEDLPRSFTATRPAPKRQKQREATLAELRESWLAPLETRYLTDLLATCDGNVRAAAERAGVNTVTMYRLLKKRGLTLKRRVQAEP